MELGLTSPLLEWTYPQKSIRLHSQTEPVLAFADHSSTAIELSLQSSNIIATIPTSVGYRILFPVANPNTQTGILQLAISIAQNDRQSAIINPLSLIELEEDYLYQSTPFEANRLIDRRLKQLNTLIYTLEPITARSIFQPIVQIGYDVSQQTAVIAALDRADLVLLGWHRPTFTNNRLGGRVAQQSGIYLNASAIDRGQITTTKNDHPTLSGRLNGQKMQLTGLLPPPVCDRLSQIRIIGSFTNLPHQIVDRQTTATGKILAQQPPKLQGQLSIDSPDGSQSLPVNFTGIVQPSDRSTPSH